MKLFFILLQKITIILLSLGIFLVIGCGQKGPLYLPDKDDNSENSNKEIAIKESQINSDVLQDSKTNP